MFPSITHHTSFGYAASVKLLPFGLSNVEQQCGKIKLFQLHFCVHFFALVCARRQDVGGRIKSVGPPVDKTIRRSLAFCFQAKMGPIFIFLIFFFSLSFFFAFPCCVIFVADVIVVTV